MANHDLIVKVGADITSLTSGLTKAQRSITGFGQTVKSLTGSMSGLSERAQGMMRDLKDAFKSSRANLQEYREQQIEIQHGYLQLARNMQQYTGRTTELMSALQDLGTRSRQVSNNMINDNIAVRMSFLRSIGAILGASTQSSSIASNLQRINNPLTNVNQSLLRVSDGLERVARSGNPAVLALQQLGPTASMAQLQSQIRLLNAGLMRMGAVALVAAGASVLLYGALHKANQALNPEYARSYANMVDKIKQAFQPMVDVFAAVMTPIYNFVAKIAEMVIRFNEAHPVLAKMIQGFLMLIPILTLILAPLAAGITYFGGLKLAIYGVWALIGPLVTGLASMMGTVLLVAGVIVGLATAFITAYNNIAWFRDMVDAAWAWIRTAFFTALEFIKGIVQTVISAVSSFIGSKLSEIRAFWAENGSAIMQIVKVYFTYIQTIITVVMGVIKTIFQTAWPLLSGIVRVAWALIKSIIGSTITAVLGIISATMKILQGDWRGAWQTIKQTASTIMQNIISYFKGIDLKQIGKDIISGLIKGIGSMASAAWNKAKEIASGITKTIKNALKIKSPSRVMKQLGIYTGEGFAIGIQSMVDTAKKAAGELATAAVPSLSYNVPLAAGEMIGAQVATEIAPSSSDNETNALLRSIYNRLNGIKVEMDGYEVGRIVEPHIDLIQSSRVRTGTYMSGIR
jgi:phage-related protein